MRSAEGADAPAVRGHPAHNHAAIAKEVERQAEVRETLDERPARSAKKEEWEELAKGLEINTDGMTKDEIIEAVENFTVDTTPNLSTGVGDLP